MVLFYNENHWFCVENGGGRARAGAGWFWGGPARGLGGGGGAGVDSKMTTELTEMISK